MLEWVYWAEDKIEELANGDRDYMEFAQEQTELAADFEKLMEQMEEKDRELMLSYLIVRENMLYRKAQLAYEYGKQVGRIQILHIK